MKKNGTLKKCGTCKIAHEMPDMACCAWYMDNVVCGDKTTEECTEYIPFYTAHQKKEVGRSEL